jgi:RHS repeat-associated protein
VARALTNSVGSITDTYDYDAFGNKINSTGSTRNNMLYQGEEWDQDLGLCNLRARYMNPLTGRFLSRDPGDGDNSNPVTLHKYLYADGDPVNGADPTGWEDAEAYPLLLGRVSVSAEAVAGVEALKAVITCALIWEGTKTYAEVVAGPFGTVEQFSPCLVIGRKPKATPVPPVPIPIPRSIPQPQPPRKGCTCACRADADDTMPGNITLGLPLFAFGTATGPSCQDASKEAKSIAIHTLRMKPKHVGCRCAEK